MYQFINQTLEDMHRAQNKALENNTDGLSFAASMQDDISFNEIVRALGDSYIKAVKFETYTGDYAPLYVTFDSWMTPYPTWYLVEQVTEQEYLTDMLPHGSGIDGDWYIERKRGNLYACHCSYHHMNEVGYYDGWIDFTVYYLKVGNSFVFKKLAMNTRALYTSDYEGNEYNAVPSVRDYLNDCFQEVI